MDVKRLVVSEPDDARRRLMPGVPAPLIGLARSHSLCQALEIALDQAGVGVDYDGLMAFSGLALRTPEWPGDPEPSREDYATALEAVDDALGGALRVQGLGGGAVDASEAMEAVVAAIDAKRPAVAFGWGSVKDEWSVIAGYDENAGTVVGHCRLSEPRDGYESWPAAFDMLVTIEAEVRIDIERTLVGVIRQGHLGWDETGRVRYRRWIEAVREATECPEMAHERAVQLLYDSRSAAALFFEGVAEGDDSVCGAWLDHAAGLLAELVEMIEGRGGPPFSDAALASLAEDDGRARWAQRLERMAGIEDDVARALRRSLTAEYPPGDEDGF